MRNVDLHGYIFIFSPRIYSGDGTLSVMDIRSKKSDLVAQSEDQEDELLSIVSIKGFVSFLSFNLTLKRHICGWIPERRMIRVRTAKTLSSAVVHS